AMCASLFEIGHYFTSEVPPATDEDGPVPDFTSALDPLEGILSYIYSITQYEEKRDIREQRMNPRAIRKLYRASCSTSIFLL
uniref:hypothetical protein n=1 Tax=Escherichia coli TaxID=562 RepID=UPI001BB1D9FF